MLQFENLKLGQIIYKVTETINWDRKKIRMVDDSGTEWYRYQLPGISYKVEEWQLIGIIRVQTSGFVPEELEQHDTWIINKTSDITVTDAVTLYDVDEDKWFPSMTLAEESVAQSRILQTNNDRD